MIRFKDRRHYILLASYSLMLAFISIGFVQSINAQTDSLIIDKNLDNNIDSTIVKPALDTLGQDTLKQEQIISTESVQDTKDQTEGLDKEQDSKNAPKEKSKPGIRSIFKGKPGKAFGLSMILPGAGQFYNKRYWKVPIALGIEYLVIRNIINTRNDFILFDDTWRFALANPNDGPFVINDIAYTSASQINSTRTRARRNREYAWLYLGVAHLIVSVEAFVDRHLIDFDISDDLSVKIKPEASFNLYGQATASPALSFTWILD